MAEEIGMEDVTLEYVSIEDAKQLDGLRLVLGAYAVPGPWREACKGLFHVKGIPYVPVQAAGLDGDDAALKAWTAQSSAPVAVWNDERPRSHWLEQIMLAERLGDAPKLVPDDMTQRVQMIGLCNELCGEGGFGWNKRLTMIHSIVANPDVDEGTRAFWEGFGRKYLYTPEAAAAASARMAAILQAFDAQLGSQQAAGSRYLVGDSLTALDIYWATFAAIVSPLPGAQCPMATAFRPFYAHSDPVVEAAVTPALLNHRDYVYERYLELPIVF